MENIKTFDEVKTHLLQQKEKDKDGKTIPRPIHWLFGNGFSISFSRGMFSYNAIADQVRNTGDDLLKQLLERTKNENFEDVMKLLTSFCQLGDLFSIPKISRNKIQTAHSGLKAALIDAVKNLHPPMVYSIPEAEAACCYKLLVDFLHTGGEIFSTNYDLLLYWTLMHKMDKNDCAIDGFAKSPEEDDNRMIWGYNKYRQNVHYLHGNLLLFDEMPDVVKEVYNGTLLLDNIKNRMEHNEYPLFVTSGDSHDKKRQIYRNSYLKYCYERLMAARGTIVTFGFGFGHYDEHIIEAINHAASQNKAHNLRSVYIGVFSESDVKHIKSIRQKIKPKVEVFDAKTVSLWRDSSNAKI